MSHRKANSEGNIPFSWEDKPGVTKLAKQGIPIDHNKAQALECSSSKQQSSHKNLSDDMVINNIPLPPCPALPTPPSSGPGKGLKQWQLQDHQDPFLLAYKECTKPTKDSKSQFVDHNNRHHQCKNKKGLGSAHKANKKSIFNMYFSCKSLNSCHVITSNNDNSFVKLNNPKLPALPRYKFHDVVMDSW